MKTIFFSTLFFILSANSFGQTSKFMTFNIRYDTETDGENKWDLRKETTVELIKFYEPQVFGIQEGKAHQVGYLKKELTNFNFIGVGRDDGKEGGEFSALFYDSNVYSVSSDTTIWLSETGEVGSLGWDASYPRVATYGLFLHKKSGHRLWVINTHFDHMGDVAREESAKLIVKQIEKINAQKLPVVLMGDFNLTPDTKPIQYIKQHLNDTFDVSQKPQYGPVGTFSGFNPEQLLTTRIDYLFVFGLDVLSLRHIDDKRDDNFFISDHLPVLGEFRFKNQ
jgi:endonuclease/exonuclease/phosphatase family metal-dependent hydrolase